VDFSYEVSRASASLRRSRRGGNSSPPAGG
jgi:hypothetical protein